VGHVLLRSKNSSNGSDSGNNEGQKWCGAGERAAIFGAVLAFDPGTTISGLARPGDRNDEDKKCSFLDAITSGGLAVTAINVGEC